MPGSIEHVDVQDVDDDDYYYYSIIIRIQEL
jgi:hypothetical protein